MFEILNAVMQRRDAPKLIASQITFGIIPTGSGNGLASTLGTLKDIDETVIKAIQGRSKHLDMMGMRKGSSETLYSFVQVSYAFIADVDFGSEALRFLGEARFDIYATWRYLFLRKYKPMLKMIYEASSKDGTILKQCNKHHCDYCETALQARASTLAEWERDSKLSRFTPIEESLEEINSKSKNTHQLMTVNEHIVWFLASNLSHIGGAVYNGPYAHLSDGYCDVTLIRRAKVDVLPFAAMLTMLDKGDLDKYRMVEYYKVREFELEADKTVAKDKHLGIYDIDGERFDSSDKLHVKVYQGLINVYA